jgi:hypothetical protein
MPIFLNLVIGPPAAEPGDGHAGSEIAGQQYCVDQGKTDGQRQEGTHARRDHVWPRGTRLRSARVQKFFSTHTFRLERRRSSSVLAHDGTVNLGTSPAANGRSGWSPAATARYQMSDFDRGRSDVRRS